MKGDYAMNDEGHMSLFIKGMIIVVFALLAVAFVNAQPSNYSLNYNIYPETNELTLQQGTDYTLYVAYDLLSDKELSFAFNTYSPEGIFVNVLSKKIVHSNFTLPLYFHVGDVTPGKYPVELSTKVLYGGLVNERRTTFYVNVVKKENVIFKTSYYTNEKPNLELIDVSTRNLLIDDNSKQTLLLQFRNTGSSASFMLHNIIDSEDKNKVHVDFSEEYFQLEKDEVRNIIVTVALDANYAIGYTPIYLFATESASKQQFDLSQINLTLRTQNVLVVYTNKTNVLEITNIGTDLINIDLNTNARQFSFMLLPNQSYYLNADVNDKFASVFVNGSEYQKIELVNNDLNATNGLNDDKNILPNIGSSIAGFFNLGSGSWGWGIFILVILIVCLIIYKLFFARKAVFANNFYVKDLKLVDNKAAH
jgi:hypothetical protein